MTQEQQFSELHLCSGKNGEPPFVPYDTKIVGEFDTTTLELFGALQNAYNYFREHLFNSSLSKVVLTLNRTVYSWGYYRPLGWLNESCENLPEININPNGLYREPADVMSTLVHEMVHHQQYQYGKPGRGKYHNTEFARLMLTIGLVCSATGQPGGKQTGDRMTHYIDENGLFVQVFSKMPKEFLLPFKPYQDRTEQGLPNKTGGITKAVDPSKTKFTCIGCGSAAWGKPSLHMLCTDCNMPFIQIEKW